MAIMKREEKKPQEYVKKAVFTEKEFIEYLEERFRKLRLDEQKFREEVLTRNTFMNDNLKYPKLNR